MELSSGLVSDAVCFLAEMLMNMLLFIMSIFVWFEGTVGNYFGSDCIFSVVITNEL